MRRRPLSVSTALLATAALSLSGGCMYRWGYEPVGGARTVAVPIFENKTLRRGLEFSLTEHLRRRILDATPLQLAREGSGAPIVKGKIISVSETVVVPNTQDVNLPLEQMITITISVQVVSAQGRVLAGGATGGPALISESDNFVPTFAQTRDSAADRALRKLAERVVDLLEGGWGGEPSER